MGKFIANQVLENSHKSFLVINFILTLGIVFCLFIYVTNNEFGAKRKVLRIFMQAQNIDLMKENVEPKILSNSY